ncbi:hypothetical protein [Algoriphagus namhaensis]
MPLEHFRTYDKKNPTKNSSNPQSKPGLGQTSQLADNRPEAIMQRQMTKMAQGSLRPIHQNQPGIQQMKKEKSALQTPIQLNPRKGKKTSQYVEDYEEFLEDENDAYDDATQDLWEDETAVIDYALRKLAGLEYSNWHDTDSSQGNYCRFIWYLDHGIKVGLNVHYPDAGPKAAGNMYIEGIKDVQLRTPQGMVNMAPSTKPRTTKTWH